MSVLSDNIERFIKALMMEGEESNQVEVRRNELAQYFNCAPSQINYVLSTRFSPDRGYYTQSRRGGGGYIRIVRIVHEDGRSYMLHLLHQRIGDALVESQAMDMITYMREHAIISWREAVLMAAALSDKGITIPLSNKDKVRAGLMREMIAALLAYEAQNKNQQGGEQHGNV